MPPHPSCVCAQVFPPLTNKSAAAGAGQPLLNDTARSWKGIAASQDAQHVVAVAANDFAWISHDGGITWMSNNVTGQANTNFFRCAISNDVSCSANHLFSASAFT